MPLGLTLLVVASILILFGVGHQVLDRMRLNDKTALLFMTGIFIGGLLPDISFGDRFSINLGGAVIPFILAVYLFIKAGTGKRKKAGRYWLRWRLELQFIWPEGCCPMNRRQL